MLSKWLLVFIGILTFGCSSAGEVKSSDYVEIELPYAEHQMPPELFMVLTEFCIQNPTQCLFHEISSTQLVFCPIPLIGEVPGYHVLGTLKENGDELYIVCPEPRDLKPKTGL